MNCKKTASDVVWAQLGGVPCWWPAQFVSNKSVYCKSDNAVLQARKMEEFTEKNLHQWKTKGLRALKKKEATLKCFLQDCEWALQRHKKYTKGEKVSEDEEKSPSQKDGEKTEYGDQSATECREDQSHKEVVLNNFGREESFTSGIPLGDKLLEMPDNKTTTIIKDSDEAERTECGDQSVNECREDQSHKEVVLNNFGREESFASGIPLGDKLLEMLDNNTTTIIEDSDEAERTECGDQSVNECWEDQSHKEVVLNNFGREESFASGIPLGDKLLEMPDNKTTTIIKDSHEAERTECGDQSVNECWEDQSHKEVVLNNFGREESFASGIPLGDKLLEMLDNNTTTIIEDSDEAERTECGDQSVNECWEDQSHNEVVLNNFGREESFASGIPLGDKLLEMPDNKTTTIIKDSHEAERTECGDQSVNECWEDQSHKEVVLNNFGREESFASGIPLGDKLLEMPDNKTTTVIKDSDEAERTECGDQSVNECREDQSHKEVVLNNFGREESFASGIPLGDKHLEMLDNKTTTVIKDSDEAERTECGDQSVNECREDQSHKEVVLNNFGREESFASGIPLGDKLLEMLDNNTTTIIEDSDEAERTECGDQSVNECREDQSHKEVVLNNFGREESFAGGIPLGDKLLEMPDNKTTTIIEDSDEAERTECGDQSVNECREDQSHKEVVLNNFGREESFASGIPLGDKLLEMTDNNTTTIIEDFDEAERTECGDQSVNECREDQSHKEVVLNNFGREESFAGGIPLGDKLLEMLDNNTTTIIEDSDGADTSDSDVFPMLKRSCKKQILEDSDEDTAPTKKMKLMQYSDENDRRIARDTSNKNIFVSLVRKSDVSKAGKIKKTDRVYDSKHPCPFCEKTVGNFSHHILTKQHKNEEEVLQIETSDGKERKKLITRLRLRGAHKHNMTVLKEKKGEIFLCRRSKNSESDDESEDDEQIEETVDIERYGPCPKCLGWVLQKSVKRHLKTCSAADPTAINSLSKNMLIVQSDILLGKITGEASQALIKEVYPIMQRDEVSQVAKNDDLIVNLGNQWMMRNRGNQVMRKYYTSSVMRLAAKMKMDCQKLTQTKANLDEFLVPKHFNIVIKSALNCCHITEADEEELNAPSNAIKLGYDVKRMLSAKLAKAIMAEDEQRKKEAGEFRKLMDIEWNLRVTRLARMLLTERSFNQPHTLPLPEDVKKLSLFLQKELESLKLDDASFCNFSKAAKLTLARVTLFNRRRCHEVQAMSLRSYAARKTGIDEVGIELRGELTKFESQLLKRNEMVVIRGKTGKGVPVILPPDVKDAFCFLCDPEIRLVVGIQESNQYVFANAGAGVFRTYDAIRSVTEDPRLQLNMPNLIRTSNMRKYMATMLQAMNTTEHERQWILDHLGHTMKVHQIHYRQTSDILERVDVAKILLIQDLGVVNKFRGKSLQDIQLDDIVECNSNEPATETAEATDTMPGLSTSGLESNTGLDEEFIPDLEEEHEDDYDDDGPVKKKRKTAKKHTRQKWTLEEENELRELFKTDLRNNKLCTPKVIEQGIKKSRDKGGVIHLRKRDLIKKKLSNMIAKQKS